MRLIHCFVADLVQKQWKLLRGQFTREHRLQKTYEPSGTGNNTSKRPRKTWYLYHSLLFLVPHISHRKTCSNFMHKKNVSTTESLTHSASTSKFASNSALQLPLESISDTVPTMSSSDLSSTNMWDSDIYNDGSNISNLPPDTLSSISTIDEASSLVTAQHKLLTPPPDKSAVRKKKEFCKEQDALYKIIGDTNNVITMTMNRLADKCSQSTNESNEEEEIMAKAISYALKKVDMIYKMQCYIKCLTVIETYQNMTRKEDAKE